MRKEIMYQLHNHKVSSHLGIAKTLKKLRQRFYWPGHKQDVTRWVTECKICEAVNSSLNPLKAPLKHQTVYGKLERIAIDIVVTGTTSEKGNKRERVRECILKAQVPDVSMRPPLCTRR